MASAKNEANRAGKQRVDYATLATKYSVRVLWSDEDGAFVAVSPEFPALCGQALLEHDAIVELREAIEMALESLGTDR